MALSRRSERKDRRVVDKFAPDPENGSTVDRAEPRLNGRSSLRLQKVLLQRNLVTEEQIEHALAADPPAGADFGDVLVSMRVIEEHALISAWAELYGMDVADLRQTSPEQQALDLIPGRHGSRAFPDPNVTGRGGPPRRDG